MAHDGDAPAALAKDARHTPADGALAAAGAHGADGDHRLGRAQHGSPGREQGEVGARGQRPAREMHHLLVADVAVGEHHLVNAALADDPLEIFFGLDRDAMRIARAREPRRVAAPRDAGNLRRRERHDLDAGVVSIDRVEIVEVAAGRSEDHDAGWRACHLKRMIHRDSRFFNVLELRHARAPHLG